ncbi:hypothetical protein DB35_24870 [Streptomyces abyssalis]|uniref:Uncharacterized protein n=1 Tax=Streptomyces abyssalis TaxID=933944 RepID=A0A1E7JNF2_9ACTN|nr:hypothetical protein [Streptomyces abyssalis]OEU86842.1 hypothetical protein DB35_24870 [Streptomyces abyssalis]OEU89774.1 hypothetical protein AN215_08695 [Streptomyces abyssalis]OEV06598.1 hypothetical protein AN219_34110 [Streptomyces nanshensis]
MDATTFGGLLGAFGGLAAAVVAFVGKRGENALNGYSSLTDNLQEERDRLDRQVAEKNAALAELAAQRAADQVEIARLRGLVIRLGGDLP